MSANKLLIPNTTQVPNILLDKVIPKLKPGAVRVLLAIVRLTYGWGKSSDRVSLNQLGAVTGLSRWGVVEAIKGLGDIVTVKQGAKGRGANEYTLNLDITTGELVKEVDQSRKLTSQVGSQDSCPSQTKSKPRRIGAAKKRAPKDSDPRVAEYLAWFCGEYEVRRGKPYVVAYEKEGALVKGLLSSLSLDALKTASIRYFQSDDSWIIARGYSLGTLKVKINELTAAAGHVVFNQSQKENCEALI